VDEGISIRAAGPNDVGLLVEKRLAFLEAVRGDGSAYVSEFVEATRDFIARPSGRWNV
jgi:hypothetical protein